jgi:hypothetical protein
MTYKHNKQNLFPLVVLLLIVCNNVALAVEPPVVVKTYGQHVGGNIVYQQQITNTGSRNVVDIAIGLDTDNVGPKTSTRSSGELNAFPVGSDMINTEINPASVSGPTGWIASIIQIQDSGLFFQWDSPGYPQPNIQPGQTMRFNITVPTYDETYLTGHFSAGYADGKAPWYYNGAMEKLDTTPPNLSVTLSPATIWPPNLRLNSNPSPQMKRWQSMTSRVPSSAPTTGVFPWPPNVLEPIWPDASTPSPIPPPTPQAIKLPPAPR